MKNSISAVITKMHTFFLLAPMITSIIGCKENSLEQTIFEDRGFLAAGKNSSLQGSIDSKEWPLVEKMAPRLGRGVNQSETKTFADCVRYTWPQRRNTPFGENHAQEQMVHSQQELSESLEISASLQAKALWGSGGGGIAKIANLTMSEKGVNWVVWKKFRLEAEEIDTSDLGFRLSEHAQAILEDPDIPLKDFFDMCGTHFYSGQIKGGLFMALYQINAKQQNAVDEFTEQAKAEAYGVLSGEQKFRSYMTQAMMHNAYVFQTLTIGGNGDEAQNLHVDNLSSQKFWETIHRLGRAIHDEDQGIVIEWHTMPYEMAFKRELDKARAIRKKFWRRKEAPYPWDGFKDDLLSKLFQHFKRNQSKLQDERMMAEILNDESYDEVQKQKDMEVLNQDIYALEQQNTDIEAIAKACLESDEQLCHPHVNLDAVKILSVTDFSTRINNDDWLSKWSLWFQPDLLENQTGKTSVYRLMGFYQPLDTLLCEFHSSSSFMRINDTQEIAIEPISTNAPPIRYIIGQDDVIDSNALLGLSRPMVCTFEYEKTCRLQMRLNPDKITHKAYLHNFLLELKLFDQYGFLGSKLHFLPSCY